MGSWPLSNCAFVYGELVAVQLYFYLLYSGTLCGARRCQTVILLVVSSLLSDCDFACGEFIAVKLYFWC